MGFYCRLGLEKISEKNTTKREKNIPLFSLPFRILYTVIYLVSKIHLNNDYIIKNDWKVKDYQMIRKLEKYIFDENIFTDFEYVIFDINTKV